MKFRNLILIFSLFVFHLSCGIQNRKLSSENYLKWYNEPSNGTVFSFEKEGVATTLKYFPLACDAAKCVIENCSSKEEIKLQMSSSENVLRFKLKFETPGQGLFDYKAAVLLPKSERMEYFSFYMKKDIQLITKAGDTIPCTNLLFERTPPDIPMGLFEIGFQGVSLKELQFIMIHNKAISAEQIVFDFSETNFNLPQIKI